MIYKNLISIKTFENQNLNKFNIKGKNGGEHSCSETPSTINCIICCSCIIMSATVYHNVHNMYRRIIYICLV